MSENEEVFVVTHVDFGSKKTDTLGGFRDEKKAWELCKENICSLFKTKNYSIDEYEILISKDKGIAVIKEKTSVKSIHAIAYEKVVIY